MRTAPIFLAVLLCTACGEGGGGPDPVVTVTPVPTQLELSMSSVDLLLEGQFQEVVATVRDQEGAVMADQPLLWSSGDPSVASVDDGLITGRSEGTATVSVLSGSLTASVDVTVTAAPWDISVGFESACALATDGSAHCWGSNIVGQLGTGSPGGTVPTPQPVVGDLTFRSISIGGRHVCALTDLGAAYCWGDNGNRQLGLGSGTAYFSEPQALPGGYTFAVLEAGQYSTCGITTAGEALCWGSNWSGQIGNGDGGPAALTVELPTPVVGGVEFDGMDTQGSHVCGWTSPGTGYCWGDDRFGTIGQSTWSVYEGGGPDFRPAPTLIGGLTFQSMAAGVQHTCALTTEEAAYCWGYNAFGQLGGGTVTGQAPFLVASPQVVAGNLRFRSIDAGLDFTCGVGRAGTGYCWGANDEGQVGNGSTVPLPSGGIVQPTAVAGDLRFLAIDGGRRAACAVTLQAEVYCWGYGELGELGNGGYSDSSVPVLAMDLKR